MEYMEAGLPVVANAVGGNPELVKNGQTGFLVPGGDPNALADAITVLLKSPDMSLRMGAAGQNSSMNGFRLEDD